MNNPSDKPSSYFIEKYKKLVVLPPQKGHPFLLCPIGLVGAGKSTVVKPLAEKLGLVRISSDEIRKLLKEDGLGYEMTEEVAFAVIQYFVEQGYGVAIDSDCARKRETIEKFAAKHRLPVRWIHINPPEEFIINKLKNFEHTWLFKDADDALKNYYARKPLHENLPFEFTYIFDTSRDDLKQQIEEAISVIKSSLDSREIAPLAQK